MNEAVLPIVERFHSLQGEGMYFGTSAFFIRLGGCNVGCPWCDTKESWPTATHQKTSIKRLAKEVVEAQLKGAAILVITGGEPLHHNLNELCAAIKEATNTFNHQSIPIHLETSGVNEISGVLNWITLSPKRHYQPKKSLLRECNEIKIIIHEKEDLIFAEQMANLSIQEKKLHCETTSKQLSKPHLFLQPGWNNVEGQNLAIEYIKTHPHWRLSLQAHKWLGVL